MKTILVTGAGGYVGSILIPKLLNFGYKVKAIDRFFFGEHTLTIHPELYIIKDDVRFLHEAYFIDVDIVIDLVAISNDPSGDYFAEATRQINYESRVRTAKIAKSVGVKQYILPSSCSVYGFQKEIVSEYSTPNPLTVYARSTLLAENEVRELANEAFTVTIIRQSTLFGFSPRMRIDLVINRMVYFAYQEGIIQLGRDGTQIRPMLHVQDTTDFMLLLLNSDLKKINREIYNVGGNYNNFTMTDIASQIQLAFKNLKGKDISIEWFGEPDYRSYKVNFSKIEKEFDWHPKCTILDGVKEMVTNLDNGTFSASIKNITLDWYKELTKWHEEIKQVERYGGIVNL